MSKLGVVFLAGLMLASTPQFATATPAAEPMHRIAGSAAWGCRDKNDLIDLLFLGISTSFDLKLSKALADGRCAYFHVGEDVRILESNGHGLVRVERGGATPVSYWTPLRNVN